jgi:hypothetical protein
MSFSVLSKLGGRSPAPPGHWKYLCLGRASGEVSDVQIRSGLPFGLIEKAMEAARGIKFEPGKKDGVAVSVRMIAK